MDLELKGKRAVVLGASRGLGAAIARELAKEGAQVLGVSRNPDPDAPWASLAMDLASPDAASAIFDHSRTELGAVDVLVNNCGGPLPSAAVDTSGSDLLGAAQPMLATITDLARAVLPQMRETGFGRIITLTSSGVREPIPGLAVSNKVRAALHAWMKTLAKEVAMDGIKVNMLMPGQIDTDRLRSLHSGRAEQMGIEPQQMFDAAIANIPTGRFGEPHEFAAIAAFLASTRASYLTGLEIPVDGGFLRS